ncbi:hypothetical protein TNCV_5078121 [Trichonephila clavipes]|uniref:Ubiquitin-like protease family profile domain-containing protein n=1 Tax=Trichonephila clavipes TaxID=2585209 RepID=A0A8X6RVF4_TRICX|nr:hypothetical protein TNCV_5078121 [Trichonephila clavipes]
MFVIRMISFLTQKQIDFIRNHYLRIKTCTEINQEGYEKLLYKTVPVLSTHMVRICLSDDDPSIVLGEETEEGVSATVKESTVASYRSKSRAGVLPLSILDLKCLTNGECNISRETEKDIFVNIPSMKSKRYDLVKSWTRKVDLFSKDYIVIPVNNCQHCFLVIVCFLGNMTDFLNTLKKPDMSNENMVNELGCSQFSASMVENSARDCNSNESQRQGMPCIYVFDSIFDTKRSTYAAELVREYLEVEYM